MVNHTHVTTNGIRLHCVEQGEGSLMLMLHGFPEFWYSWRHQIREFSSSYKVVAPDLRGYNDSEKPAQVSDYQMSVLVEDVKGLIDAYACDRCILVGHDWGGAIAWQTAYAYPELIDQLIVMNLPHPAKFFEGLQTPQQLLRSWYIFFFQLPAMPEWAIAWNDYELIEKIFKGTAVNPDAFSREDINAFKDAAAKRGALTAMVNYYRNILRADTIRKDWPVLSIPTLMIWGEDDTALGLELTHGTDRYVEDLTLQYIPNCSHWVQQEQPDQVNQYMRDFLSRFEPDSSDSEDF
ncbi:MAG: alpha/beta hydrolase [Elainellaceae cyanobacterium]